MVVDARLQDEGQEELLTARLNHIDGKLRATEAWLTDISAESNYTKEELRDYISDRVRAAIQAWNAPGCSCAAPDRVSSRAETRRCICDTAHTQNLAPWPCV